MVGNLTGATGGEGQRKGLCGLGCWAVLWRGFSVSLDNWTVTWKRRVTQKIRRSTKNWSANTATWLQREEPRQAAVWAAEVTGIIRHWADQPFLINKLSLPLHWLMGLKGTSGSYWGRPRLGCFSMLLPWPWPYNTSSSNAGPTSSGLCVGTRTTEPSDGIGTKSLATAPLCSCVSDTAWGLRRGPARPSRLW